MINLDSTLLAALAQPCVGAFIGYLTNKIAIRMLFRPLRPWYVFKWRVPLTPGIIPSKRHELAVNIGEMVGMRLLTSEEIGRAISGEAFQEHLHTLVSRRLDIFWYKELPALNELFPAVSTSGVPNLQASLTKEVQAALAGYIASPQAEEQLSNWLEQAGGSAADTGNGDPVLRQVAQQLLKLGLASSGGQIGNMLNLMLQEAETEGRRLRELLPEELSGQLHSFIEAQSPVILERIGQQVLAEDARPALLEALISMVHQLLESLGPMGAMARGFFEADTFKRKINEYLDKNRSSIENWLNSPQLQKRLSQVLQESAETVLDKEIAELLAGLAPGQIDALCASLGGHIAAALQGEAATEQLAALLGRFFEPDQDGALKPARLAITVLRSGKGRSFVDAAVESLVQQFFSLPLGTLTGRISDAIREQVAAKFIRHANHLLLHELSGLVQAINIKELVSEKVDSLDLLQLERLLLGIMEEQFKYINLFGALLGFLIGLINLLIFQLS